MCGISGYFRLPGSSFENHNLFLRFFKNVNAAIYDRGPDCFGAFSDNDGLKIVQKTQNVKDFRSSIDLAGMQGNQSFMLCNFRGIPTTEFVVGGYIEQSIQPYADSNYNYVVTHNGQLSNDKDLIKKHNYPHYTGVEHDIDSYYFINLIKKTNSLDFLRGLQEINGSYALAAINCINKQIYFARDFKGLYFAIWERGNDRYLVYSSEAKSFENCQQRIFVREFPLNSALVLGFDDLWFIPELSGNVILDTLIGGAFEIRSHDHKSQSAVVVLSGGMDSTVCATMAAENFKKVHFLHFMYGAKAQEKEITAVQNITRVLVEKFPNTEIELKLIDLDFIKKLGGSTLTEKSWEIAQGELGVETDHEWVPARNLAMISLAASYCDRHEIGNIILGLNNEEGGVFCDNSIEFYEAMEEALKRGTKSQPKLMMPLGKMMKRHIAKKGLDIDAPLYLSWSCYLGGEERCGTCGPCVMRQRAFAMNGVQDNVFYIKRDDESARILAQYELL